LEHVEFDLETDNQAHMWCLSHPRQPVGLYGCPPLSFMFIIFAGAKTSSLTLCRACMIRTGKSWLLPYSYSFLSYFKTLLLISGLTQNSVPSLSDYL
jgi:hypothetical protein